MTNLISELTISITLLTNWTAGTHGTKQLGYVSTNQEASFVYQDQKYYVKLRNDPSSIAVWRDYPSWPTWTNTPGLWIIPPGMVLTNIAFLDAIKTREKE